MQSFHCYSHKSSKVLWDTTSNIGSVPMSNKILLLVTWNFNVALFLDTVESFFFLVSKEILKIIVFSFYIITVE